jgi:hypothetical protein
METSSAKRESWYYFIQYNGNEDALKKLNKQLELVDDIGEADDDTSFFDIDILNLISEACVDEMILVELNSDTYHRKFFGVLDHIDFEFKRDDDDATMIEKINDLLEGGGIENYIEDEFIPSEHAMDDSDDDLSDTDSDDGVIDSSKLPKMLRDTKL